MPAPQTARQLLETEPGVGLCDACLALTCDTSLTAMRKITAGLVAQTGGFRRGSTCESCGRVVASTLYARSTTTMLGLPYARRATLRLIGRRRRQEARMTGFFARVAPHLAALSEFLRHEIAYLEATGDLEAGDMTPDDVIDEVLLRASREFDDKRDEETLRAWLIALARETLAAAVASARAWRRRTPARLEADIPDTPPREWVTTLGDERLDYWEPDEDLKLEDLLPDLEMPTPEDEAARRELRECLRAALTGLPRDWRRALLLRHVEGLGYARLARMLGTSTPEIHRLLDHARQYLRQRLVESGCRFRRAAAA